MPWTTTEGQMISWEVTVSLPHLRVRRAFKTMISHFSDLHCSSDGGLRIVTRRSQGVHNESHTGNYEGHSQELAWIELFSFFARTRSTVQVTSETKRDPSARSAQLNSMKNTGPFEAI